MHRINQNIAVIVPWCFMISQEAKLKIISIEGEHKRLIKDVKHADFIRHGKVLQVHWLNQLFTGCMTTWLLLIIPLIDHNSFEHVDLCVSSQSVTTDNNMESAYTVCLNWPWAPSANICSCVLNLIICVCARIKHSEVQPVVLVKPRCHTSTFMFDPKKHKYSCRGRCHARGSYCRHHFIWAAGLFWYSGKHLGHPRGEETLCNLPVKGKVWPFLKWCFVELLSTVSTFAVVTLCLHPC